MNFFVVDDEKFALDRMVRELKVAAPEAEIFAFSDPYQLLEFATSKPCDVAFLDVRMGSMTGVELAKKLKEFMPKLNIIFVTGYDEYANEAMKMGHTPDAVLCDVENAMEAIGEVTGRTVREDIVNRIFERFCVGK